MAMVAMFEVGSTCGDTENIAGCWVRVSAQVAA
jgi:hypothetical protein